MTAAASDARLLQLPKAELHVHLDGSLRPSTMIELAAERGVSLPSTDPDALFDHMVVSDARNLQDYLDRFTLTLSLMQDEAALERIAYELAADHAAENVRYVEVRFCPILNTEGGLDSGQVLDAVLAGLRRAETDFEIRTGVIVCALRSLDPAISNQMAEVAVEYADRGVCAFDLAGGEDGNPVRNHLAAFDIAHEAGLPITIHAGEAFGPASIAEAIDLGHAQRIGHGTRLGEDPALLERVKNAGIPLEVCLTSNVQTRAAASLATHPARPYADAGVRIVFCTDNRLMSGVSLTEEYVKARDHLGFDWAECVRVARTGFECAFVGDEEREAMLESFDREIVELG